MEHMKNDQYNISTVTITLVCLLHVLIFSRKTCDELIVIDITFIRISKSSNIFYDSV